MSVTFDAHKNFGYTTVTTAPAPPASGTSIVVTDGTVFPATPFNAVIWPLGSQPTNANAEIVRVTLIVANTLTITRAQEGSAARTVLVGDQISNNITAKALTDIESGFNTAITSVTDRQASASITANVLTIDYSAANVYTVSLNAQINTLTINNWPASGTVGSLVLIFTADGTPRTIAWPAATKWPGGVAPTMTSTLNKVDIIILTTYNAGTNIFGQIAGQNF